jgi:aldose 1-epimerase
MMILENERGMRVTVLETGGAIQSILVPDREGRLGDVVLGCGTEGEYPAPGCLGAMVGRFANRIAGAAFPLNGRTVRVTPNEGPNCLHGGRGFHTRPWALERTAAGLRMSLVSPDGDEGFPGEMRVTVDLELSGDNCLTLRYAARSDADTVVNLTNHSYFNLAGSGTILDQELMLASDAYLEVDRQLIPTGRILDVTDTDFDFRSRRPIRSGMYDHCFLLRSGGGLKAEAWDPVSGRGLRMYTDQPAVQLYCGAGLRGVRGKGGAVYPAFGGFCLETQHYPDAPNHPEFPGTLLRAGEEFTSTTRFAFFAE